MMNGYVGQHYISLEEVRPVMMLIMSSSYE